MNQPEPKYLVGIDPDSKRSGICLYQKKEQKIESLMCLDFFDTYDFLFKNRHLIIKVIIEAGWMNDKSDWHSDGTNPFVAAKVGKNVGRNHQTGQLLSEMCDYLEISHELRVPKSSKIDKSMFAKITGYMGNTNQEERDAAILVYGF